MRWGGGRVSGFGVLGFRVSGLRAVGFGELGRGPGVQGLKRRLWYIFYAVSNDVKDYEGMLLPGFPTSLLGWFGEAGSGFKDLSFRVPGFRVAGSGRFWVEGLGFRVSGLWLRG